MIIMNHKIITIILIFALLITPAVASTVTMDDNTIIVIHKEESTLEKIVQFLNLELGVSPPSGTAQPGQQLTYDIVYYNQYPTDYNFQTDAYIGDNRIGRSAVTLVPAGEYKYSSVTITAPETPGTYTVEFYSYYGSTEVTWWEWDALGEVFITLTVSSETPTGTPTSTPTGTPTASPTGTAPPANSPPIPSVTKTVSGNVYSYDASGSTDPDGTIVSYSWTVDGEPVRTGPLFEIDGSTFSAGTHTVKLAITDNDGATSTYRHEIITTIADDKLFIKSGDESTIEGEDKEPSTGIEDALFVINIAGQSYSIPGFSGFLSVVGLLAALLISGKKKNE